MAEQLQPGVFGSWIPSRSRAKLARNNYFLIFAIEDRLYSIRVETLLEVIAGHRESCRIMVLELRKKP
jgi:hypothetical protein